MPLIRIHSSKVIKEIITNEGTLLQTALHEHGYDIYSPCGGRGICGKCNVYIRGEGSVSSCLYPVMKDINVILPDKREADILVAQHDHIPDLPFSPGKITELSDRPMGVAIDIGTTTIVLYLVDLLSGSIIGTRSVMNPQSKFGADVISRINYCAQNPDGLKKLQHEVLNSINTQLNHFIGFSDVTRNDIVKITIAGNTTMLHLLLAVNPLGIALAPYTPVFTNKKSLIGSELGMNTHPQAEIILLPSISAYVGADIVAGLASIKPSSSYRNFLFIDIGTNGEIALVTPKKIWCCSTAAGPAFEGACITCGMGAFEGAISAYNDNGYTVIADAIPAGICGSGLVDIIAFLLEKKIINTEGYMNEDFVVVNTGESSTGNNIIITPSDVREVQLAKSAIMSGIQILLKIAGISVQDIDFIYIAGGFGNYIRISSAIKVGIIPKELENKVIPIGNASGTGAVMLLKSVHFEEQITDIINRTEYIELSLSEDFPQEFAMNMFF